MAEKGENLSRFEQDFADFLRDVKWFNAAMSSPTSSEDEWETLLDREKHTPQFNRAWYQESFLAMMSEMLLAEVVAAGTKKADIARKINRSRAFVTQVLSGDRNMTLRTLADLVWALDCELVVWLKHKEALSNDAEKPR